VTHNVAKDETDDEFGTRDFVVGHRQSIKPFIKNLLVGSFLHEDTSSSVNW
jgi:hypothetical protein